MVTERQVDHFAVSQVAYTQVVRLLRKLPFEQVAPLLALLEKETRVIYSDEQASLVPSNGAQEGLQEGG